MVIGFISRIVVAIIFGIAGVAKLRDLRGTSQATEKFGVPAGLALPFAALLGATELAIAVGLFSTRTASLAALTGLLLLLVFAIAIGVNLILGRTPECHCFGQLHSAPVSWKMVFRNLALSCVAAVAWIGTWGITPRPSLRIARFGPIETVEIVATAAVFVLSLLGGFFFLRLMRAYGRLVLRLDAMERGLADAGIQLAESYRHGLPPGTPVPPFAMVEPVSGRKMRSSELFSRHLPVLLIFTSHECGACESFLPEVAQWQKTHASSALIAVSTGSLKYALDEARQFGLTDVFVDEGLEAYKAFQVNATPSAVLLTPTAGVGSYVTAGRDAISKLLDDVLRQYVFPITPGTRVPPLELSLLGGGSSRLNEFLAGTESVLLFWNPACHYCQSVTHELRNWESQPRSRKDRLVVISSGDAESSTADRFLSVVFLDPNLQASTAFGASGTPTAIRIDSNGYVASQFATGAAAVLNLVGVEAKDRHVGVL